MENIICYATFLRNICHNFFFLQALTSRHSQITIGYYLRTIFKNVFKYKKEKRLQKNFTRFIKAFQLPSRLVISQDI